LVAENVELLVGDVENGLLDALADARRRGWTRFWTNGSAPIRSSARHSLYG